MNEKEIIDIIDNSKSWDNTWDLVFQNQEWGKYPPEELIRFIARNYYKINDKQNIKILDVGCGTGAATWFISREGFKSFGIDGSETAIKIAKERLKKENLNACFEVGDFIKLNYDDNYFDCVIDIVALQHNNINNLKKIIDEIYRVLKPGGKIFSMMINKNSVFNDDTNPFENKGYVHIFEKNEVLDLFKKFKNLVIDLSERTDRNNKISHFIITGQK